MQALLRFPAALGLLLVATIACEPSNADDKPAEERGLKLSFPEVEGWELSAPRPLPPQSGGYSVGYNSKDRVAVTIYVYNRGLARIPNDLSAQEVQRELTAAKEAILEARRLGFYEEVREEKSEESMLGGQKMLYARFRIRIDSQENLSEIYVLPYRNHFVKLRVTRAAQGPATVQTSLDRLYAELSKVLVK